MGRSLIFVGIAITSIGVLWHFAPWTLNWFGKLPGDIRIENENSRVFIPITSMVIVSVVISLVLGFLNR